MGFVLFLIAICCVIYIEKETKGLTHLIGLLVDFFEAVYTLLKLSLKLINWVIKIAPKLLKILYTNLHWFLLSLAGPYFYLAFQLEEVFWVESFELFIKMFIFGLDKNPLSMVLFYIGTYGLLITLKERFYLYKAGKIKIKEILNF
jgi:hypothetical protein